MASNKNNLLTRGFKAKAEKLSLKYRDELGIPHTEALSGFDLAQHFNIKIFTPEQFGMGLGDFINVIGSDSNPSGWSALTMVRAIGDRIIIHNHLHAPARQQSNIMHELAHIICEHQLPPAQTDIALPFYMREYDPVQEEEANILGSALIVSREGLLWALKKKMSHKDIADYYTASEEMVRFRINSTGVMRQLRYS